MNDLTTGAAQGAGGVGLNLASMDVETMLLSLNFERTQALENVVRDQMGGMQIKNGEIRDLNNLTIAGRNIEYKKEGAEDLMAVGKQMSEWGSAGGRSWMNPDFKDVLDKYGIEHKASNMDKSAMSNAQGGWYVSYPTAEYHALGQQVMEKAAELQKPMADLTAIMPGSSPPQSYADAFKAAGIPLPKDAEGKELTKLTEDQMKGMLDNVQSKLDSVSSSSQLDMIRMQSMINKRNQAVEMLTNLVQKFAKTSDTIVGNIR
ncbi:MAG TPA: hypothetical protein VFG43_02460 [Geminicoccaceae bacterium]|nr:hypothetical protein [Geminicoccaceae bacterium]